MNSKLRWAVVGLAVLVVLGLGIPLVAGATVSDMTADPVSTTGHIYDQWGWHNNWGSHQHGDHWGDHPHHGGTDRHEPHGHGPNQ